jgi:hypothetical protein
VHDRGVIVSRLLEQMRANGVKAMTPRQALVAAERV